MAERSDDEIRADMQRAEEAQYKFSDAPLHGAAMHRLGADVGPLLDRAVTAERERDAVRATRDAASEASQTFQRWLTERTAQRDAAEAARDLAQANWELECALTDRLENRLKAAGRALAVAQLHEMRADTAEEARDQAQSEARGYKADRDWFEQGLRERTAEKRQAEAALDAVRELHQPDVSWLKVGSQNDPDSRDRSACIGCRAPGIGGFSYGQCPTRRILAAAQPEPTPPHTSLIGGEVLYVDDTGRCHHSGGLWHQIPPASSEVQPEPTLEQRHQAEHEKYGSWPCAWAIEYGIGCPIFDVLAAPASDSGENANV